MRFRLLSASIFIQASMEIDYKSDRNRRPTDYHHIELNLIVNLLLTCTYSLYIAISNEHNVSYSSWARQTAAFTGDVLILTGCAVSAVVLGSQ